jgi:hypothetical protein
MNVAGYEMNRCLFKDAGVVKRHFKNMFGGTDGKPSLPPRVLTRSLCQNSLPLPTSRQHSFRERGGGGNPLFNVIKEHPR